MKSRFQHMSSNSRGITGNDEARPQSSISYKTGWAALVEVFKIAKEVAAPLPPLQAALSGLVMAMEIINNVGDAKSGFTDLAKECAAIQSILQRYSSGSGSSSFLTSRLGDFTEALAVATKIVESKGSRGVVRKVIEARGDVSDIRAMFTHLSLLISNLQLDLEINTQQNVEDLAVEDKLAKLRAIHDASIISQDRVLACLPGTRLELLGKILAWAHDPDAPSIFWLNGMAGTGKSAIARTLCQQLQDANLLGSSFFCSRKDTDRSNAQLILPTLAYFLARRYSNYRNSLVPIIQAFPDVATATVDRQFQSLFLQPFERSQTDHSLETTPFIIVVDAVDECSRSDAVGQILKLCIAAQLPLKFFITGRPEALVRLIFEQSSAHVLRLHDIEEHIVEADVELFLGARLQDIRNSHPYLEPSWPGDAAIRHLTRRTGKLFIFAFTVCKFLERDPRQRFRMVTASSASLGHGRPLTKDLDDMYTLILDQATDTDKLLPTEVELVKKVVSHVILLRQSLSVAALSSMLQLQAEEVRSALHELHAVISVPDTNSDEPIFALHASLVDYLLNPARSGKHCLDKGIVHFHIAEGCLRILESKKLHFNVGHYKSSYLSNDQSHASLLPELVYASRNLPHHVLAGTNCSALHGRIRTTFYEKFLCWLEVLSLAGIAHEASSLVSILIFEFKKVADSNFVEFLRDANSFIIQSMDVLLHSAPHIYLSALPMTITASRIYRKFRPNFPRTSSVITSGITRFRPPLLHLIGHTSSVLAIAYYPDVAVSRDGARIVSGSRDCTVRVWDGKTGEVVVPPLQGHTKWVTSVAFSPDGTRIVSGSHDCTIRIWDTTTGKAALPTLKGHTGAVKSVAFSPNSERIVSGSRDWTVRIWDVNTGEAVLSPLQADPGSVNSVAFSPNGKSIVSGSEDKTVRVWDAATGQAALPPLQGHTRYVTSVAFSPDGARIVSGSGDKTVRVWDASTGEAALPPLEGHAFCVNSVAFSPDGQRIASGSDGRTIRVWDATADKAVPPLPQGHTEAVTSVVFSPDGKHIVSGSRDNTARMWDAMTGEAAFPLFQMHPDSVTSVAFSPDSRRIVTGSQDGVIRMWDVTMGKASPSLLQGHIHHVASVAFSPDGTRIVSGSGDCTVRVWDATTGEVILPPLEGHSKPVLSVAFSPDGVRIASAALGDAVRLWDATTGEPILPPLAGHANYVTSVAFSPDGKRVVLGSADKTVRVWDATTGEAALPPLQGHTHDVTSVAFSPDGARIASGSDDRTIQVWDATTSKSALLLLRGHAEPVTSVAFSLSGARIVSGSTDRTIRVWDTTVRAAPIPICFSPHPEHASPTLSSELGSADRLGLQASDHGFWITGPDGELLFWVPRDLASALHWPRTSFVISNGKVYVDLSKFVHGENWTKCRDPLPEREGAEE